MKALFYIFSLEIVIFIVRDANGFHNNFLRAKETIKPNKMLHISNWKQYDMPGAIEDEILKIILHKIALFRALRYCPYEGGMDVCLNTNMNSVVKKIIADTLLERKYPHSSKMEPRGSRIRVDVGFKWVMGR